MSRITLFIERKPQRWSVGSTRRGILYNPHKGEKSLWKEIIQGQFSREDLIEIPVRIRICYFLKMPKSWPKLKRSVMRGRPHGEKPDIDNLNKFTSDCLIDTVLIDDKIIADSHGRKFWSDEDGIAIAVEELGLNHFAFVEQFKNGDSKLDPSLF